jgi:hypothetical protein
MFDLPHIGLRIREVPGNDANGGRENCSFTMIAVRIRKFKANRCRKTREENE